MLIMKAEFFVVMLFKYRRDLVLIQLLSFVYYNMRLKYLKSEIADYSIGSSKCN